MDSEKIVFENDIQQKIMNISFRGLQSLVGKSDVLTWRKAWTGALKSWHSPYKALVDCNNLTISDNAEIRDELERMLRFFKGFFLKKVVGFGFDKTKGHTVLPFPVHPNFEEAAKDIGMRGTRTPMDPSDFRGTIQLANHFQQHVMELTFAFPVVIDTKEKVATLRSKITNNLMPWHSRWSLLIDCSNLEIVPELKDDFAFLEKYFKGFFLKQLIGYSPKGPKESYPFPVFRARHAAAARLEAEGMFSGDQADCNSRKG